MLRLGCTTGASRVSRSPYLGCFSPLPIPASLFWTAQCNPFSHLPVLSTIHVVSIPQLVEQILCARRERFLSFFLKFFIFINFLNPEERREEHLSQANFLHRRHSQRRADHFHLKRRGDFRIFRFLVLHDPHRLGSLPGRHGDSLHQTRCLEFHFLFLCGSVWSSRG
jgi:hypothetical protein